MTRYNFSKLHHAVRTYSELCQRWFTSQSECARGEELWQEQLDGKITDLDFQTKFVLSAEPKLSIKVDFAYKIDGKQLFEDSKGILTREYRAKLIMLKQLKGVDVILSAPRRYKDPETKKMQVIKKQSKQQELADTDAYLNSVIK